MLLCFPLTILGCAQSSAVKPPPAIVTPANTQDLAAVRCPPADQRTAAEFQRTTRPPAGDITKRAAQEWLDAYEEAERRKNRAGQRLLSEYESCRSGSDDAWQAVTRALGAV